MALGGNYVYHCKHCGKKFLGWSSAMRVYCSRKCAKTAASSRALTHGESRSRLYQCWRGMRARCSLPSCSVYEYYGGRGISVCSQWDASYELFRDWSIANGYQDDLEIDRIDVNGNYEPSNCRWVTRSQQMRNTRKRRDGVTSKFKGVSWCANASKWRAQVSQKSVNTHVGVYASEIEAALAYDDAAFELSGEFAKLNFPERKKAPQIIGA